MNYFWHRSLILTSFAYGHNTGSVSIQNKLGTCNVDVNCINVPTDCSFEDAIGGDFLVIWGCFFLKRF